MPIPKTREQLVDMVETSFRKLDDELEGAGPGIGDLHCVDDWSVKELLAVRAWWSVAVVDWIEAGRRGESTDRPAVGYSWQETPRLNDDIARRAADESYEQVLAGLRQAYRRVRRAIDELDDRKLLEPGAFEWAGKWPIARWISINTARQYTTARTFVRRAVRGRTASEEERA